MRKLSAAAALVSLCAVLPLAAADVGVPARAPAPTVDAHLTAALEGGAERLTVLVHGSNPGRAAAAATAAGLRVLGELRTIDVAIAVGTAEQVRAVTLAAGVTHVEHNRTLRLHMETARTATRVAEARRTAGMQFDGSGETIAIVDSGADGTHPMFRRADGSSKIVRNFRVACIQCPGGDGAEPFLVEVSDSDSPGVGGHGTHVSGIAAGLDVKTSDGRALGGVATGANLVVLGSGAAIQIYGAAVSLDWIARHHADPCGGRRCAPITVVNNSYGPAGGPWDPDSAVSKLIAQLVRRGITVVFSNGNGQIGGDGGDGTANQSNPFAQAPFPGVIAVANYDDAGTGTRDGALNDSSSRGQRDQPATWPDLSAPGTAITSSCRPYLPLCASVDEADPSYGTISGTSMAAPHVAGAVAILQHAARSHLGRRLSPAEVENILEDSAHKLASGADYQPDPRNPDNPSSFDKGHGLLDMVNAINVLRGAPRRGVRAASAAAACAPGAPLATDPKGDATRAGAVDAGQSTPTLDVVRVGVGGDPGKQQLVVTFRLADLTSQNPAGTSGIEVGGTLTVAGRELEVTATRSARGARFVANGTDVDGVFDAKKDTVTVRIPRAVLDGAHGVLRVTSLTEGSTRRSYDPTPLAPVADEFAGSCGRTVDLGGAPERPDGVAAPGRPFTWAGERTSAVSDGVLGASVTVEGTHDDVREVLVQVPPGGTVEVVLTCDVGPDYDLYLAGPDGSPIGAGPSGSVGYSATPTCDERIKVRDAPAGLYQVTVVAFATVRSSYQATITVA